MSRFSYQILLSGVYVFDSAAINELKIPFWLFTGMYLMAITESYIPSVMRKAWKRWKSRKNEG